MLILLQLLQILSPPPPYGTPHWLSHRDRSDKSLGQTIKELSQMTRRHSHVTQPTENAEIRDTTK